MMTGWDTGYNFDEIKNWNGDGDRFLVEQQYLMMIEDKLAGKPLSCRINLSEIKKLHPACSYIMLNFVLARKKV
jgi:hypothetical protein